MNSRSSLGTRGLSVSGCTKFGIKISLDTAMESFRRCRWDSLEPMMHRSKVFLIRTCAAICSGEEEWIQDRFERSV